MIAENVPDSFNLPYSELNHSKVAENCEMAVITHILCRWKTNR